MPTISDRKLATLYKSYETQLRTNPDTRIDTAGALKILASVGDGWNSSMDVTLARLQKPGLTRDQQVAIAKEGLTAGEKKDLETILDRGIVPLDPGAKAFLELTVGRTPINPVTPVRPHGILQVTGNQANGLTGSAKAGDTIEAINISAAPTGRLTMEDTMVIGKADASGRFANAQLTGDLKMQEGDLIKMRARHADGTTGDWVTIKATGIAQSDTRNAAVAVFRVGLTDGGNGKINVANINASRPISEPGAVLQFTNVRSGVKTKVTIDDKGTFPANLQLEGKSGDVFSIAATDGKNNTAFATEVGKVTVPGGNPGTVDLIKDPALHKDELNPDGTPRFSTKRFTGPLFKDGANMGDVAQGQIGDCYLPSAIAAIANVNPEALQNMIKENGDGTYTVTFKEKDWATGRYKNVEIKVDGDLYTRSWGGPLYGSTASPDKGEKTMELWFPLVEKAYAAWKGSFDAIGNGGMTSDVMQEVLGKDGQDMSIKYSGEDKVFTTLKKALDAKQPVSAGTFGDDQKAMYTNTGVYANHSYSVLGYSERDGEKFVKLRNPWGESEPAGNGPNDGVFELKLKEFTRLYQTLMYTNP